jgi:hypothetical protein
MGGEGEATASVITEGEGEGGRRHGRRQQRQYLMQGRPRKRSQGERGDGERGCKGEGIKGIHREASWG